METIASAEKLIKFTFFRSLAARTASICSGEPWSQFVDRIKRGEPHCGTKRALPLISGAVFGEKRTAKKSLRHDENILVFSMLIGDHDAGTMKPHEAAERLEVLGIKAIIHTTASDTAEAPHWHVIAPLATEHPPADFPGLMARLNGALGGVLTSESFTASQSFYVGSIKGGKYTVRESRGAYCIDEIDHLEDIARPTHGTPNGNGADDLEGHILRGGKTDAVHEALRDLALDLRRHGQSPEDAAAFLRGVMERASWRTTDSARWQERYDDIDRLCEVVVKVPDVELTFAPTAVDAIIPAPAPPVLDTAALHGLAGDFVRLVKPRTEASAPALLMSFLTAIGCAVGRNPFVQLGATKHRLNLFVVLVGTSSRGRKGTAGDYVKVLLDESLSALAPRRLSSLSSGEGLIHLVRDPRYKEKDGEMVCVDGGEPDKRLLVVAGEFGSILAQLQRGENTLSAVLRDAWDSIPLQNNIRDSGRGGETCKEPHIAITAHCTTRELLSMLTTVSIANGFGNRHLFIHTAREGEFPLGGEMPPKDNWQELARRVDTALRVFDQEIRIQIEPEAAALWSPIYSRLVREIDADAAGLADALCSRLEAHAWRLMAVYAVLDMSQTIRPEHVRAAKAVLDYSEATVRAMFATMTGDPIADRIIAALRKAGSGGLSRNDIYRRVCQANTRRDDITGALKHLQGLGIIDLVTIKTDGRPAVRVKLLAHEGMDTP